jgi:ferrous iron transport protein A
MLSECPIGSSLRLDGAALEGPVALRLKELGLRDGCELCVEQRAGFGGRVVRCGTLRLALDALTASRLQVSPLVAA